MREALRRAAIAAVASAAFGAAVGSYVGGMQIVYAAIKMPLFLLGTGALCAGAILVLSAATLSPSRAMETALKAISMTAAMLGALAPPLFLLGISTPKPAPRGYLGMVVALTLAVGLAGIISVARLRRELPTPWLWIAWIAIYGFVGAQMAWLLKPWIGYTLAADRFLPLSENLHGNFYEAAWGAMTGLIRR